MARILVAEDEASVRDFVARALGAAGYDVLCAEDGVQAMAALARERFDLVLTDIVMPGLDGIALALRVAKDHPGLPVLLMTGYAAERQRAHNLDALISQTLFKPFSLRDLLKAVALALPVPAPAAEVQGLRRAGPAARPA